MKGSRAKRPATSDSSYEKISATLDRDVLRKIRERTDNVSEYLNEAAADRLYWEHLNEMAEELRRRGAKEDPKFRQFLLEAWEAAERLQEKRRSRAAGGRR